MDTIRILMILLLVAAGTAGAQDADADFKTIQERMTAQEFVNAGLHELSQEQLNALNEWLRTNMSDRPGGTSGTASAGGQQAAVTEDTRGLHSKDEDDIYSRIVGEFDGWHGYTEFELENGMVWQQVSSDTMRGVNMTNPRVRIYQGLLGWRLEVEGINKTTPVKRIK